MKARVLYLTPRFPFPADRGDRLHAFHSLRVLAERFDVTLACFVEEGDAVSEGKVVFEKWGVRLVGVPLGRASRIARMVLALATSTPLQVAYYAEPEMRRVLEDASRDGSGFDAVVCHLLRTAAFGEHLRARIHVVDLADSVALSLRRRLAHAPLLERPSIWIESRRVARLEEKVLASFDEGWVVSDVDRQRFPASSSGLVVIPPGIDETLFEGEVPRDPPPVIGFLGHLSVPHNVDAAVTLVREILPRVVRRGVDARVLLIGASPSPAVRKLAGDSRVELAGFVPRLATALQGLRVLCAPIRFSAGVQSKLIDGVAAGVPVLTSPEAVAGLGQEARPWIGAAHSPDAYADEIVRLWTRSPQTLDRLRQGREWARGHFRWERYVERLEELLQ